MPQDPHTLIQNAFARLAERPGFVDRPDQLQLAYLLSDTMDGPSHGAFEAPTGLGKSLAALIPAIAQAIANGKRTVIATYTNVLAEQYWREDLPLALSLVEEDPPRCEFLIGRQRYACLAAMAEHRTEPLTAFRARARLGIESELRSVRGLSSAEAGKLWPLISVPPVCPARLCPHYQDCYYYRARRSVERASILITNHSVVLQDALLVRASAGEQSLLGDYDCLILDEAHDFPQAAANALEFELSEHRLNLVAGIASKLEHGLLEVAAQAGDGQAWVEACVGYVDSLKRTQRNLAAYGATTGQPGILAAAPPEIEGHEHVKRHANPAGAPIARDLADEAAANTSAFVRKTKGFVRRWKDESHVETGRAEEAADSVRNYTMYLEAFGDGCSRLLEPEAVSVTYLGLPPSGPILRHDVVDLAGPLQDLLWSRVPTICLSATLALDGGFGFFERLTGFRPEIAEILPTPFDFGTQAALYLPKAGTIPDPSEARKSGFEAEYFDAVARELGHILRAMGGRTLALFHSRREMEAVRERMNVPDDLPIYMQRWSGAASAGERFKAEVRASLFALRSFWTGFDAPGETLTCVVLVRVPFEVPVDPPQVARIAWLQTQGVSPFGGHSLPLAKMMMRQGAGRLIRRDGDRGVIAVLDPRLRTKSYGDEIVANFPEGICVYDDLLDAAGHVGLE